MGGDGGKEGKEGMEERVIVRKDGGEERKEGRRKNTEGEMEKKRDR